MKVYTMKAVQQIEQQTECIMNNLFTKPGGSEEEKHARLKNCMNNSETKVRSLIHNSSLIK